MACPVCDHTMQGIAGADRVFWCPRCGTLKDCGQRASAGLPDEVEEGGNDLGVSEPKLVHRSFQLNQMALEMLADAERYFEVERLAFSGRDWSTDIKQQIHTCEECIGNPS